MLAPLRGIEMRDDLTLSVRSNNGFYSSIFSDFAECPLNEVTIPVNLKFSILLILLRKFNRNNN